MSVRPHAFVAMPFGTRPGPDGLPVDFNRVYAELLRPAIEAAGLEAIRADEEVQAGDIRRDLFQELLVADLVVADISIEDPTVWYELGVRHALRARGVVLTCGGRATTAFDLYTDRKLRYGVRDGGPDPSTLAADVDALARMIRETMESWHGRKISPVYAMLPQLEEPEWARLRIADAREFWEQHDAWEGRLDLAVEAGQLGDLLVLAEEAPVAAFRAEAALKAGDALRRAGRFDLAIEQLDRALAIEPTSLHALREKGICLQRLARERRPGYPAERARDHCRSVLGMHPTDVETWALLGRVDEDAWTDTWHRADRTTERMRDAAAGEDSPLRSAIESFARAFRTDPRHHDSGIHAVTLMHLYRHLTGDDRFERDAGVMSGAVRFAAESEHVATPSFRAAATLGDLEVLVGDPSTVPTAYQDAIARNESDRFALDACREQLVLLRALGFRPEAVAAGIDTFDRAIARLDPPVLRWEPRQVLLFSGHLVDAPGRPVPRFPAECVGIAGGKIDEALEEFEANDQDLALCQAAAGGDLLFLEACQRRGVRCEVLLPFAEPEFLERSVLPSTGGEGWRDRFHGVKAALQTPIRIMPEVLGPLPRNVDPFERCNLWLLYSALSHGADKVRFVALWNGGGGDGPGGTAHLFNEVERRSGRVRWLDTRKLW